MLISGKDTETSRLTERKGCRGEEPMKTLLRMFVLCLLARAGVSVAQDKPAPEKPAVTAENPLSTWNKLAYARVKGILLKSAEKMPEENFSFRPVDTVRTYGQIVG